MTETEELPFDPALRERVRATAVARGRSIRHRQALIRRSVTAVLVLAVAGGGVYLSQSNVTSARSRVAATKSTVVAKPGPGPTGPGKGRGHHHAGGPSGTTTTTTTTTIPNGSSSDGSGGGSGASESWSVGDAPPGITFERMSCGSMTFCVAFVPGGRVGVTHDFGGSWTIAMLPQTGHGVGGTIDGISCGSATSRVISGSSEQGLTFFVTADGGASWSAVRAPMAGSDPGSVSCWDSKQCLSVTAPASGASLAPQVYATADGGLSWSRVSSGNQLTPGEAVLDCVSSTSCFIANGGTVSGSTTVALVIRYSDDDGASWTEVSTLPGGLTAPGLSCGGGGTCLVVGTTSIDTNPTGPIPGGPIAPGVSPTLSSSTTPGSSGPWGTAWYDTSESTASLAKQLGGTTAGLVMASVSCANARDCWAIGNTSAPGFASVVIHTTDGGANWGTQLVDGVNHYSSIYCDGGGTCLAVGGNEVAHLSR